MLHNIFGDVGSGKTMFLMRAIAETYFERGQELLENSRSILEDENTKRRVKLKLPDKVPIYCNFKVQIPNPDGSIYEPYFIKGSEIGLGKKYKKIYPGAVIFIDEAQDEFNSKNDLPRAVSAFFEKHRHADYEIWLASQRPILINKDIRDLSRHFVQINNLEMDVACFGIVCGLTWHCCEFDSRADVDEYVDLSKRGKSELINYRKTEYNDTGDILDWFDSKSCLAEYFPEEGQNYAN